MAWQPMTPDELRARIVADCYDCKGEWEVCGELCSEHAFLMSVVREVAAAELDAAADYLDDGDWMGQHYGTHPVTHLRDRAARWRVDR